MFKVNSRDTRTLAPFSNVSTGTYFTPFSTVSTADFD